MRRPRRTTLDPSMLDGGSIGVQTASFDRYFHTGEADETLTIIVQAFVDKLEEPVKTSLQMCVMQGISYAEAAKTISAWRGKKTDPKTVWKWAQKGKRQVASLLQNATWASEVSKIPRFQDEQDEGQGHSEGDVGRQAPDLPWIHGATFTEPVDST